jgi:hypothetical protein
MLTAIFVLIYVGLIGGGLFTAGIVLSMMSLVIAGIALLVLSIMGMLVYCLFRRPASPHVQIHNPMPVAASYSTNNMNTMKRNKSDTDLELINRQTADDDGNLV